MSYVETALISLLLLGGCGEEDRTEVEFTPSNEKNILATDDRSPSLVTPSRTASGAFSGGGTGVATASLAPTAGESVGGEAKVHSQGGTGGATVRLTGGRVGQTYSGQILTGTCDHPGSLVTSLVPITADSTGAGASFSDMLVPVSVLTGDPHIVTFGVGGRMDSCGMLVPGGEPM